MPLKPKATHNLFLFYSCDQRDLGAESYTKALFPPAAIEDFRQLEETELFFRLESLGAPLEQAEFFQLASMVETPQEATELLIDVAKTPPPFEKLYLVIFELWRRLLPERKTFSIFCDELDRQIFLYNQGTLRKDEALQKSLAILEKLFQEQIDQGEGKKEMREHFDRHMAHDLDHFLYEYITDLMASRSFVYAEELVESFYYYMHDRRWFDFLLVQIIHEKDPVEAHELLRSLIKEVTDEEDVDLQFEMLHYMIETGDRHSFIYLVEKNALLLRTEEDFVELMAIVSEYYRRLDQEDLQEKIERLIEERSTKKSHERFEKKDQGFQRFVEILGLFR